MQTIGILKAYDLEHKKNWFKLHRLLYLCHAPNIRETNFFKKLPQYGAHNVTIK